MKSTLLFITLFAGSAITTQGLHPMQVLQNHQEEAGVQIRQKAKPTVVEGHVYFEKNSAPAEKVYVYIVEGEEEYLTDKNGYFRIETWQKLPVHVTVQQLRKPATRHKVADPSEKQVIWLK